MNYLDNLQQLLADTLCRQRDKDTKISKIETPANKHCWLCTAAVLKHDVRPLRHSYTRVRSIMSTIAERIHLRRQAKLSEELKSSQKPPRSSFNSPAPGVIDGNGTSLADALTSSTTPIAAIQTSDNSTQQLSTEDQVSALSATTPLQSTSQSLKEDDKQTGTAASAGWKDLPVEVLVKIAEDLPVEDVCSFRLVSRKAKQAGTQSLIERNTRLYLHPTRLTEVLELFKVPR
jgi:hypothetical protein